MNYAEFESYLAKAHLSKAEFAQLVRAHPNSITNCRRRDHVPEHWHMVLALIVAMEQEHLDFRKVLLDLPIQMKKSRGGARPGRFGGDPRYELDFGPEFRLDTEKKI